MATLKSKKMERSRDLKTPLAVSTMDKAKGNGNGLGSKLAAGVSKNTKAGPGDPPKKKTKPGKSKKKYTGKPEHHTKITYSTGRVKHLRKGELEKIKDYGSAMRSGKLKKKVLPDGRIHYTYKKD
jgi:hypothetical protein